MNRPVLIYLAGPMDDIGRAEAQTWREQTVAVAPAGVVFYSPSHAYLGTSPVNFPAVDKANRLMVAHGCDGVLVNLTGPGRGFGTIREIEFAVMHGTPVAVVGEVVSLMSHDLILAETLEDALAALVERIHEGRQPPPGMRLFSFGDSE